MIKKLSLGVVTLLLSICAYAGMWQLVNTQYNDGNGLISERAKASKV